MRCLAWLLLMGYFFNVSSGHAQKPILLNSDSKEIWVSAPFCEIYEDTSSALSLKEVITRNNFQKPLSNNPLIKNYSSAYWLRFMVVDQRVKETPMRIEFYDFNINEISFYSQTQPDVYLESSAGFNKKFDSREIEHKNVSFLLKTRDQDTTWFYIRCHSNMPNVLKPVIKSYDAFASYGLKEYFFLGLFYGLMLIMVFYNLLYFILLRKQHYAYYVLFASGVVIYLMTKDGIGFQYLWPGKPWLNHYMGRVDIGVAIVSALLFTTTFLDIKTRIPRLHLAVLSLIGVRVVLVAIDLITLSDFYLKFIDLLYVQIILGIGVYALKNGFKSAKWFVYAFCAFDIACLIVALEYASIIPSNPITVYALQLGIILQFVFLSISIAESIKEAYEEKNKAQKGLISQLEENKLLSEKVNKELEQKVADRTKDLVLQKSIIEEKNKLIIDSVRYAETIQKAALPDEKHLKEVVQDNFVLFKPRDIVSGDFYWVNQLSDNEYLIAAVDCTGHGIPGAFMSMIGINLLNQIVSEGTTSPAGILLDLHEKVQDVLKQQQTHNSDGMDLSICKVDLQKKTLKYSGARNPLLYAQRGKMNKIKATRTSIGGEYALNYSKFEEHTLSFEENPITFYLLSDGYVDQIGGEKNSKMLMSRLMKDLEKMQDLTLEDQKKKLESNFEKWLSFGENQFDDVMILGVRLS